MKEDLYILSDEAKEELYEWLEDRRNLAEANRAGYIQEIIEGYEYLNGNKPEKTTKCGSSYVDRTVFDQVQGVNAQLQDSLLTSESVVKFKARAFELQPYAVMATQHINREVLQRNRGNSLLAKVIETATLEKASFVMPSWIEETSKIPFTLEDATEGQVAQAAKNPLLEITSIEEFEVEDGTQLNVRGWQYIDTSHPVLTQFNFEEVAIDHKADSLWDAEFVAIRSDKAMGEFVEEDEIEVHEEATYKAPEYWAGMRLVRNRNKGSYDELTDDDATLDRKLVTVNDYWFKKKLGDRYGWWNVKADTVGIIGQPDPVERCPLVVFEGMPSSTTLYGLSIPDITKDIQVSRTMLKRGLFDNMMNINHPQVIGVKGQINIESIRNRKPDSLVIENAPGMIRDWQYQPITNEVNLLSSLVSQDIDTRTGLSNAAQGLDDNVLKNDNAFSTVNLMMSQALQRMKRVSLNFAQGLVDLNESLYNLIKDKDKRSYTDIVNGTQVTYSPSDWPDRMDVKIDSTISPSDKAVKAQNLMEWWSVAQQTPVTQGMQLITQSEQVNFLYLLAKARNLDEDDISFIMKPLAMGQPAQPSPMEQIQMANAQAEVAKTQNEGVLSQAKAKEIMERIGMDKEMNAFTQQSKHTDDEYRDKELRFKQEHAADQMGVEHRKLSFEKGKAAIDAALTARDKKNTAIGDT